MEVTLDQYNALPPTTQHKVRSCLFLKRPLSFEISQFRDIRFGSKPGMTVVFGDWISDGDQQKNPMLFFLFREVETYKHPVTLVFRGPQTLHPWMASWLKHKNIRYRLEDGAQLPEQWLVDMYETLYPRPGLTNKN